MSDYNTWMPVLAVVVLVGIAFIYIFFAWVVSKWNKGIEQVVRLWE